ncbi:hypothetical protein GCK72_010887 [Caenorhabditis remanei]|uniref:Uncharacterized protein n=1 Tax=Caenorhabditis remanei TaxID=31234 RepID=A0A6A5H6A3_CAERE|nr:hypothetical protein GCK72_010887 [Caenorhabditis remanei]KAF1762625.1 hypothetical protein GCK72_010887 [Caenorhabditis remanei]
MPEKCCGETMKYVPEESSTDSYIKVYTYKCSKCGSYKRDVVNTKDMGSHSTKCCGQDMVYLPAESEENEIYTYKCSKCGKYHREVIDAEDVCGPRPE